ncbi:hypothetical protein F4604DRAFT_1689920 [Suillus subluteus]|nr:hypothetical protein F4604DRAFT_1689920 [Suillus subluteus]
MSIVHRPRNQQYPDTPAHLCPHQFPHTLPTHTHHRHHNPRLRLLLKHFKHGYILPHPDDNDALDGCVAYEILWGCCGDGRCRSSWWVTMGYAHDDDLCKLDLSLRINNGQQAAVFRVFNFTAGDYAFREGDDPTLFTDWRGSQCLYRVQGVATRDDIDKTFRLGMAHPTGPLQLADLMPASLFSRGSTRFELA